MDRGLILHLGPLAALAGIWEGQKGEDGHPRMIAELSAINLVNG